jgi:hypothetical protein
MVFLFVCLAMVNLVSLALFKYIIEWMFGRLSRSESLLESFGQPIQGLMYPHSRVRCWRGCVNEEYKKKRSLPPVSTYPGLTEGGAHFITFVEMKSIK